MESSQATTAEENKRLQQELAVARQKIAELEKANHRFKAELAARTADLEIALQKAQEANLLKSRFISDINHELRTPLNNLVLYLSFLEKGKKEKRPEYLNILRRETERLQWLITQLLDFSRLDAGSLSAHLEPVDLNNLAETLVNDRRQLAQDKNIQIQLFPANNIPLVRADSKLLFQSLTNLVSNAINYTMPGGRVEVQTRRRQRFGRNWVTVTVKDNGIGISKGDQTRLFERFYRGEAADITNASGAGIGLAICREFIELMGGEVTVEGDLGSGSEFTLWLQPA